MPRNGSGSFSIINTFTPLTAISSAAVNADLLDIAAGLTASIAKDGQTAPSANLPMANFHHTGVGNATLRDNYAAAGQVQDSTLLYAGTSSGTNTITATLTPAITAYVTGQRYTLKAGGTCVAGATTLNINSVGAKSVKKGPAGATDPDAGDITLGGIYDFEYDGTNLQLLNPASSESFGTEASIAGAATTDIGTIASHNVLITGTATITSFGSSATPNSPFYMVKLQTGTTIVHDATNIVVPGLANYVAAGGDMLLVDCVATNQFRIRAIMPRNPAPSVGSLGGLQVNNNAITPTTQLDVITTGRSILESAAGATISIAAQSLTINAATTGVNGLDTGALAASTWYYIWLISNGSTVASLLSLSATAPTLPAGYVYRYRAGSFRTGAASTFLRIMGRGRDWQYVPTAASTLTAYPTILSGGAVNTSTSVSAVVPPTATKIRMSMNINTSAGAASLGADAQDPLIVQEQTGTANTSLSFIAEFLLEGANIFTGGANSSSKALGWTEGGVNAS